MKHYLIAASILVVAVTQVPDFIANHHFNKCVNERVYRENNNSDDFSYEEGKSYFNLFRASAVMDCNGR